MTKQPQKKNNHKNEYHKTHNKKTNEKRKSSNNYLLPYETIAAATTGDVEALNIVLKHFGPYINALSRRILYDEAGQAVPYYDQELKRLLEIKLIVATLKFKPYPLT